MRAPLRSLILPAVLALAALVVLVSLGNWQVRRLAWKEDLIQRVEERISAAPVDLPLIRLRDIGDPRHFLDEYEYRPVQLDGVYEPAGEVRVFTSLSDAKGPLSGPGYWVLTPFAPAATDAVVYVNRGFIPDADKSAYSPPPAGTTTISGPIRAPELGSWFTPSPDIAARIFYSRDVARIAEATDEPKVIPDFFIDLDASRTPPSGLPQAGETRTIFPNSHLGYAVTWYGLAAALLGVFGVFAWGRLRRGGAGPRLTPPGVAS